MYVRLSRGEPPRSKFPSAVPDIVSLENILLKFDSIFACNKEEIGLIQRVEHFIALKDRDKINYFPNRRVPLAYEEKIQAVIKELLKGNIIRPS